MVLLKLSSNIKYAAKPDSKITKNIENPISFNSFIFYSLWDITRMYIYPLIHIVLSILSQSIIFKTFFSMLSKLFIIIIQSRFNSNNDNAMQRTHFSQNS